MHRSKPIPAIAVCLLSLLCACQRAPQVRAFPRRVLYYRDPMHPSYHSDHPGIAPDCNMALTPVYAGDAGSGPSLVQVDQRQATAIGLRTEAARSGTGIREIRTVGRVLVPESRKYQVTAGADGWVRKVYGAETGSLVAKGQPLASYYSRDLAPPQQAYLYALDSLERMRASNSSSQDQKQLATKQLTQAHDYLEFLGMTNRQIADLEHSREEGREVTLGAPAPGVVLQRKVSEGARFMKGDVLWEIGDIESVWIAVDVFPEDLAAVSRLRTAMIVTPDGAEIEAAVDSSVPGFEPDYRVARLRLVLSNTAHKLLPGMTVTVRLQKLLDRGITVPAESVIESGINPRAFVRRADGSFEARAVTTGWRSAGRLQILSGIAPGEQVVVAGAFLIDSESRMTEGSK
jgi:membrane fusion protein, copper/silver efflux system